MFVPVAKRQSYLQMMLMNIYRRANNGCKNVDGKVAIISGASYGMGQTMAELFAEEGAKVVMTARGKEKLDVAVKAITEKGYEAVGVVADNEKEEDVKKVFRTAVETYGDLDIVINNAAIGKQTVIEETTDEWLEHVYNTNVFGTGRYIREALKIFMPKRILLLRLSRALL